MSWYKVSEVSLPVWDSKDGIGAVPWNQEVDYRGFIKMMSPREFRSLVPAGSWGNAGKSMAEAAKAGQSFGPPFLIVDWKEDRKIWQVIDHEGRSRSDACEILSPGVKMPVHIFPRGMRARDLTDEMKRASFLRQEVGK